LNREAVALALYEAIKAREPRRRIRSSTPLHATTTVLEQAGFTVIEKKRWYKGESDRPTLAAWLRERHPGTWIIGTTTHALAYIDGRVVEDNGAPKRRGRMKYAYRLQRELPTGTVATVDPTIVDLWRARGASDARINRPMPDRACLEAYREGWKGAVS
jgi:hypothetical protein